GPEIGLAPDPEAEEVVHWPAQHLRVAVQLRDRHRPAALLDRDLGRAREAELLGHHRLRQAQELSGLGDALADGLIGFHVAYADFSSIMIDTGVGYCQGDGTVGRHSGSTTCRRSIE